MAKLGSGHQNGAGKASAFPTMTKAPARMLALVTALAVGVAGCWCDSAGLLAVAAGVGLLSAGRQGSRATPVLLSMLAGCTTLTTHPPLSGTPPRALGVTARLAEGNPAALPASVAAAVDAAAELEFHYSERVHQADNEVPGVLVLTLSPIFLLGVPTGSYAVTVSAQLTVSRGAQEVARYEAEVMASRLYGFYYGSTVRELEVQARTQVRRAIDEALYRNSDQLAAGTR